jgi:hypothetical protein
MWEFVVSTPQMQGFESAYSSAGVWSQLFRRDPAYVETMLLHDANAFGRYVTVDLWQDRDSYLSFKARFADDYQRIDQDCDKLTAGERFLGIFDRLP